MKNGTEVAITGGVWGERGGVVRVNRYVSPREGMVFVEFSNGHTVEVPVQSLHIVREG